MHTAGFSQLVENENRDDEDRDEYKKDQSGWKSHVIPLGQRFCLSWLVLAVLANNFGLSIVENHNVEIGQR